ncbi:MAG TPA: fatty acid desaturase [Verrucomicrobiae bacterium]|nr:fatty acid desaturase [Verrucomicrobiae bacterium]
MGASASESASDRGKSRHFAFCFLPHVQFVLLAFGLFHGGYWLLLPAAYLLLVVPLLDGLTGWEDDVRFQKTDFSRVQMSLLHWNTRLYAILYVSAVLWIVNSLARFTPAERGYLMLSMSLLGGICFAAAHELLHRKDKVDQVLQRIATAFLFYPHYKLIHVQSHHPHVATAYDKNTAWLNENVYAYILRTVPESMARCWEMETEDARKEAAPIWRRIFHNGMYAFALGQFVLLGALYWFAGPQGLLFYFGQVLGAHIVLESVNYIQHYGLLRKGQDGRYEQTAAEHSWDTYHYFSSYSTFRVGHHSFHHLSLKPYYLLGTEPNALKLPVGYFWSIPMVLVPPLWRRVINPKISSQAILGKPDLISAPS